MIVKVLIYGSTLEEKSQAFDSIQTNTSSTCGIWDQSTMFIDEWFSNSRVPIGSQGSSKSNFIKN